MADLAYLPWRRPEQYDERPCVADDAVDLTYAEFGRWVDAVAEQLAESGVGRGDVVAIMLPNRVELLVAMVAAWRLGAAATPVNPAFTALEADRQIRDAGSAVVVTAGPGAPDGGCPAIAVGDLRREPAGAVLPEAATSPDDVALIIYTSGSTGVPKGALLSHGNLDAMTTMMGAGIHLDETDHCLLILPLFHANAIFVSFLTPIRMGARLTVVGRFSVEDFVAAIERCRPTYFSGVPAIYGFLIAHPAARTTDWSSIRFGICGAAPASAELLAACEEQLGFPLIEGYGLTEGTCASTANPVDGPRKLGSVGVALPGQRVAVMDDAGNLLPPGERGEVVIAGPTVMLGYLNRPEDTAATIREDADGTRWLHTGDVGVLDDDGYLRIVDRIKDMIIRGGENIYPQEIEAALHAFPGVFEAAVIGAPDPLLGEVPVAYVTPWPDTQLDVEAILEHCRDRLTRVKVPTRIVVVDAIAKNPVGKTDKPALRRQYAASTGAGA